METKFKNRGNHDQSFVNKTIDEMISDFMELNDVDGLSMAIVQAPYISRSVGYGISDKAIGSEALVSTNTVFPIGEMSLGFLAVALMQAHELNLLDIKDSVSKWIPELKKEYHHYDLLMLMNHLSRLPDFRNHKNYDSQKKYSEKEIIEMINELEIMPSDSLIKNASNAYLIALAIKRASKLEYHEFLNKYQINLLKLPATFTYSDLHKIPEDKELLVSKLHQLFKSNPTFINPVELAKSYQNNQPIALDYNLLGFSDVGASASDISFWDIGLAGNILVKNKELSNFIYKGMDSKDQWINASAGWEQTTHKGFLHTYGSVSGFSSYLSRFTDKEDLVCVTLLANKANLDFNELARKIAASYKTSLSLVYDDSQRYVIESSHDALTTYEKIKELLKKNKVHIFYEMHHDDEAVASNLTLGFSKTISFGNPLVGTQLMLEDKNLGLEFPLRIQVFTDQLNRVWISTHNLISYANYYDFKNKELVAKMDKKVKEIVNAAAKVYASK